MAKLSFQEELDRLIKVSEEELMSDDKDDSEEEEDDECDDSTEDAESPEESKKLSSLSKTLRKMASLESEVTYDDLYHYVRSLGNGRN